MRILVGDATRETRIQIPSKRFAWACFVGVLFTYFYGCILWIALSNSLTHLKVSNARTDQEFDAVSVPFGVLQPSFFAVFVGLLVAALCHKQFELQVMKRVANKSLSPQQLSSLRRRFLLCIGLAGLVFFAGTLAWFIWSAQSMPIHANRDSISSVLMLRQPSIYIPSASNCAFALVFVLLFIERQESKKDRAKASL